MASNEELEARLVSNLLTPPPIDSYEFPSTMWFGEIMNSSLSLLYAACKKAQSLKEAGGGAISYRDCDVYAAGIILSDSSPAIQVVYGYNIKLGPGDAPNIHAEDMILAQLKMLGGLLLAVGVFGPLQPDDGTGRSPVALMPCSARCTPKIAKHEGVGPFTAVVGINPENGATALTGIAQLAEFYNGADTIHQIRPEPQEVDEPTWQVMTKEWRSEWSSAHDAVLHDAYLRTRIDAGRRLGPAQASALGGGGSFAAAPSYDSPIPRPGTVALARNGTDIIWLRKPGPGGTFDLPIAS